jgi:hypothetical protein
MNFIYAPRRVVSRQADHAFTVHKLWAQGADAKTDLSHLIDRSYAYRSPRELRWHLAERFGLSPQECVLNAA